MVGRIQLRQIKQLNVETLLERWLESSLVSEHSDNSSFTLTSNASWLEKI
jgi:hypothetical protein